MTEVSLYILLRPLPFDATVIYQIEHTKYNVKMLNDRGPIVAKVNYNQDSPRPHSFHFLSCPTSRAIFLVILSAQLKVSILMLPPTDETYIVGEAFLVVDSLKN